VNTKAMKGLGARGVKKGVLASRTLTRSGIFYLTISKEPRPRTMGPVKKNAEKRAGDALVRREQRKKKNKRRQGGLRKKKKRGLKRLQKGVVRRNGRELAKKGERKARPYERPLPSRLFLGERTRREVPRA